MVPRTKHPARTGFRGLVALAIEAYEDYSEIRGCGAGRCASSTSSLEGKKVSSRPGSGGSRLLRSMFWSTLSSKEAIELGFFPSSIGRISGVLKQLESFKRRCYYKYNMAFIIE